ncbi:MAG: hypothetical protein AVDCRST_MAG40-3473, partial [uncultured Gemmatimonadaceae bacterium]
RAADPRLRAGARAAARAGERPGGL